MGSPSKLKITLLGLLVVAVLLFAVFKLRPDILGPIGGGVASRHEPSPEDDGDAAHRVNPPPAPEPTTPALPGPEPVRVATKIVTGEVNYYRDDVLWLRLQDGRKVKFSVTENTRVTPGLKSGKRVNVQYREEDGQNIALWVQPAGPQVLAGDR